MADVNDRDRTMQELPQPRAAAEALLERILQQGDFPVLSEHVRELMAGLADPEITFQQLSAILRKDVGLALRVVRTANSWQYNRSGKPILTLNHAVALIGLESLRDLTAALLLVQHFRARTANVKALMALSLLTANHTRAAAAKVRYPQLEESYLCGMFRGLGEVLAAAYFEQDYAKILALARGNEALPAEVAHQVLGCGFADLGQAAARHWKLPQQVTATMMPRVEPVAGCGEVDRLCSLVSFGANLTEVMHRTHTSVSGPRLQALLRAYDLSSYGMKVEDLREFAEAAIAETKATFDLLRIPLDSLQLKRQVEAAVSSLDSRDGEPVPAPATLIPADPIEEAVARIEAVISSPTWDINEVFASVLDGVRLVGGFDRALLCLVSADHRTLQARLASGCEDLELLRCFQFPISRQGPVGAAVLGRRDLLVVEGPYMRSDLAKRMQAACFGLYPLVVDGIVAGCLYFDRVRSDETLNAQASRYVRRLRDLAAQAIALRRRAA